MASIWVKSLLVGCSAESPEAWKLRKRIVEVCCCDSKLLNFFDKSSNVAFEMLAVLRYSLHHEELLDADDHR